MLPQTPEPFEFRMLDNQIAATPENMSTDPIFPITPSRLDEEPPRTMPYNLVPQAPDGGSSVDKISAFTPVLEVPQNELGNTRIS